MEVVLAAHGWRFVGQRCEKTARAALRMVLAADGRRCGVTGVGKQQGQL
jgi:hypothetical protein